MNEGVVTRLQNFSANKNIYCFSYNLLCTSEAVIGFLVLAYVGNGMFFSYARIWYAEARILFSANKNFTITLRNVTFAHMQRSLAVKNGVIWYV